MSWLIKSALSVVTRFTSAKGNVPEVIAVLASFDGQGGLEAMRQQALHPSDQSTNLEEQ